MGIQDCDVLLLGILIRQLPDSRDRLVCVRPSAQAPSTPLPSVHLQAMRPRPPYVQAPNTPKPITGIPTNRVLARMRSMSGDHETVKGSILIMQQTRSIENT